MTAVNFVLTVPHSFSIATSPFASDSGFPGGIPAGGSPPSDPGDGGNKRDDLLQKLARYRDISPSPTFALGLGALLQVLPPSTARKPDALLGTMTSSFRTAAHREIDLLPCTDLVLVSSALHFGREALLRRSPANRTERWTTDLLAASAHLCLAVEERRLRLDPPSFLAHDLLTADTIMSLKACLNERSLSPNLRSSLGAALCRAGALSGSLNWQNQNLELPNLVGALWTFFGPFEDDLSSLLNQAWMFPEHYFESAADWRPSPLGPVESLLSQALSQEPWDSLVDSNRILTLKHIGNPTIRKLHARIRRSDPEESRKELVKDLVELAAPLAQPPSFNLPDFLRAAFSPLH